MSEVWKDLKEPFNPAQLHWRVGSCNREKTKGMVLAYIDARDVMKRLDDVVGPENWQDEYITEPPRMVRKYDSKTKEYYNEQVCGRVICRLSIRIGGEWITKSDGAGETHVEAEKGAISDAFKRAAVKFGVGRYLYYLPNVWVDLQNGNLPKNFQPPKLPVWAYPKAA